MVSFAIIEPCYTLITGITLIVVMHLITFQCAAQVFYVGAQVF